MKFLRIFIVFFILLVLLCLCAGYYLYREGQTLLQEQLLAALQPYGVADLAIDGLALNRRSVSAGNITLSGEAADHAFQLNIHDFQLDYDRAQLTQIVKREFSRRSLEKAINDLVTSGITSIDVNSLKATLQALPTPNTTPNAELDLKTLSPPTLLRDLPQVPLQIADWQLRYTALDAQPLDARGNLQWRRDLQLAIHTKMGGTAVDATIQASPIATTTQITLELSQAASEHGVRSSAITLPITLNTESHEVWQWSLATDAEAKLLLELLKNVQSVSGSDTQPETALSKLQINGATNFAVQISHPALLQLPLGLDLATLNQFAVNAQMDLTTSELQYADSIKHLSGALQLAAQLEQGQLALQFAPHQVEGHVAAHSLPLAVVEILELLNDLDISWRTMKPAKLNIDLNALSIFQATTQTTTQKTTETTTTDKALAESSQPTSAATSTDKPFLLLLPNALLEIGNRHSKIALSQLALLTEGNVDTSSTWLGHAKAQANVRLRGLQLPPFDLQLKHQGAIAQSAFNVGLDDQTNKLKINLGGKADLVSGAGKYDLHIVSTSIPKLMQAWLRPLLEKISPEQASLREDIAFTDGRLDWQARIQSKSYATMTWKQQSNLSIAQVAGNYGEYTYSGLDLVGRWHGIDTWHTDQSFALNLKALQAGLAISDIQLQVALPDHTPWQQPRALLERFDSSLLGGKITLNEPQVWDLSATENAMTLEAERLELAEIVKLQQESKLQASGRISGSLPIRYANGRLGIQTGTLQTLPPGGWIRYSLAADNPDLAASNEQLSLALELLQNFQFEVLQTTVDLNEWGQMNLGLSLRGRNPEKYEGRNINFNVNLEQNIDPLLQSLRLSDTVTERIESKMK